MFNGQTSIVAVPCKYRLADIQCGDYHLRVTPGSLDSNNTFSPYRVFVKMQKTAYEMTPRLVGSEMCIRDRFNGQTSTVAVPCKYRLADIQCGDYRPVSYTHLTLPTSVYV